MNGVGYLSDEAVLWKTHLITRYHCHKTVNLPGEKTASVKYTIIILENDSLWLKVANNYYMRIQ